MTDEDEEEKEVEKEEEKEEEEDDSSNPALERRKEKMAKCGGTNEGWKDR